MLLIDTTAYWLNMLKEGLASASTQVIGEHLRYSQRKLIFQPGFAGYSLDTIFSTDRPS